MGDEPYIEQPKQPDSAPARFMAAVTAARQAAAQAGEAGDVGEPELWELPAARLAADPAAANFLKWAATAASTALLCPCFRCCLQLA